MTEFPFDMWRRSTHNLLIQASVDNLDLMFIMYMNDFWVKPACCQNKQYKVELPHECDFLEVMV